MLRLRIILDCNSVEDCWKDMQSWLSSKHLNIHLTVFFLLFDGQPCLNQKFVFAVIY